VGADRRRVCTTVGSTLLDRRVRTADPTMDRLLVHLRVLFCMEELKGAQRDSVAAKIRICVRGSGRLASREAGTNWSHDSMAVRASDERSGGHQFR
jgi:hypothetical protein